MCNADFFFGVIRYPRIFTCPYSSSVFLASKLNFSNSNRGFFFMSFGLSKMLEYIYSVFYGIGEEESDGFLSDFYDMFEASCHELSFLFVSLALILFGMHCPELCFLSRSFYSSPFGLAWDFI